MTAEPDYSTGSTNSLYFCDLNIFSDGTFAYSDVSLSSSYEAAKAAYNKAQTAQDTADAAQEDIDKLNIGGRNLLRGSNTISAFSKAHGWSQNGTFTDFAIDSFVEDGETIMESAVIIGRPSCCMVSMSVLDILATSSRRCSLTLPVSFCMLAM